MPQALRGCFRDSAGGDRKACPPVVFGLSPDIPCDRRAINVGRDLGDRPAVAVFGFAAVSGDALGEVQPGFGNSEQTRFIGERGGPC